MKLMNKEFLFMVVFNFIIILLVMFLSLSYNKKAEEIYNMMPDQSLSEDTT